MAPKKYDINALKQIALKCGDDRTTSMSSRELSLLIGASQQAASKKIIELAKESMIERKFGPKKQVLSVTDAGWKALQKEFTEYQRIFASKDKLRIRGEVASGLGEGGYYISQSGYVKQISEKLGFSPFKGTLNIKVSRDDLDKIELLAGAGGVSLESFQADNRTFGAASCFACTIQDLDCAVIIPKRTHYTDTIEVISKHHLRKALELADGKAVEIVVQLRK